MSSSRLFQSRPRRRIHPLSAPFWFYSHPAVYIMISSRHGRDQRDYSHVRAQALSSDTPSSPARASLSAVIGFLVWAHHMFVTGESTYAALTFLSSAICGHPSAVKVFNWTSTLYKRLHLLGHADALRVRLNRLFLMAASPDCSSPAWAWTFISTTPTSVVAHFHYIMVGGGSWVMSAAFTSGGRRLPAGFYPETLSRIAAVTLFVGFNLTFFPNSFLATSACRAAITPIRPEFQVLNVLSTAGASYSRWVIFCR